MGGIEYIATAMRSRPTGSELQFSACRALAKLARHADNLVKIEAAGGVESLATSMRSHPTDGKLQLSAYLASRTGHKHRRGTDRRQSAAQVRRDLKNTAAVLGEMGAVGLTSILLCGVVELPRQCARKYLTTTQGTNAAAAHVSWAMNTDGPVTEATQLPGAWDECQVRRMPVLYGGRSEGRKRVSVV